MSLSPKDVVRRFYKEFWNERKLEVADQLVSQSHALTSPHILGLTVGPAAYKKQISEFVTGFPDLRFTVETPFARKTKSPSTGPFPAHTKVSFSESRPPTKKFR